ncbi:MAG: DUF6448 family protein, partial [Gemmatimonadota bacterium]
MSMRTIFTTLAGVAALSAWTAASPAPASAHCDSVAGPVVKAARAALEQQNVALVLGWVRLQDEPEIRAA